MGVLIIPIATTAQRTSITPDVAELIYDTTLNVIFRGDGATLGGVALSDAGGVLSVTGPNVNNTDPVNPIVNARVVTIGAGANVTVDNTDPNNPIVSASAASGGQVNTVVGTTNEIAVNIADPVNPIVSLAAAVVTSLGLANSAIQAQTLQLSGAYSDEGVTDLVASTTVPVWSKRVGYPFSMTEWKFDVMTAPTGSAITPDVHKNGTSIYATRPTIAAAAFVSSGGVLTTSPTAFAVNDLIEVFTDIVGSTIPGRGLKGDPIGILT